MTQKEITNAFIDAPTLVGSVKVRKYKWMPIRLRKDLQIRALSLGKVRMIASELEDMIGADSISDLNQADQINRLLKGNIAPLVRIIAIACSSGREVSPTLVRAISDQFTMQDLSRAFNEVYRRLDLSTFFDILVLAKNLTLSLIPEAEAPGQAS